MKRFAACFAAVFLIGGCCYSENNITPSAQMKYPEAYKSMRTDAPALSFPAVMPIYSTDDGNLTQTRALMQHLYETGGVTQFAIMFPLNPQGKDPYDKAAVYADRFARLRKLAVHPEWKIGILMQQTIGMSATWNKNPNLDLTWQRTVTMENAPSIRFCPLDPDFRAYIRTAVSGLFKSKPDFIIYDDDTRLHIQKQVECFCQRHVDHFNKKYGTNYTPSELQSTIKNAPEGAEIIRKFAEARRETLVDYMSMIRAELDKHNPDARGIYCSNSAHLNDMQHYGKAAAGKHISAIRPGNGAYLERSLRDVVFKKASADNIVALHKDVIDEFLDESDTCPHSLFSKSAHTMNFHIIYGILNGMRGGKLWIANTRFYDPKTIEKYPQVIGKHQGLYRELVRTLRGVTWHGAQRSVPPADRDPRLDFPGSFNRELIWESKITGYFGLPHRTEKSCVKGVHMLSGDLIKYYTSSELERFLSEGCLLDASAAKKLAERGFSKLVGVIPELITTNISAGEWMHGMDYPIRVFGSSQYKLVPADKNKLPKLVSSMSCLRTAILAGPLQYLSEFRSSDFYQSANTVKVCDGAALFVNEKGAKIITVPFDVCDSRISIVPERKNYMIRIFDLLGVLPAWSCEPFDIFFRFGTLANGKQDIAAVCNISYEPMEEVNIGVKKVPAKIEKLSPDGGWDECRYSVRNGVITIADSLECAETGIYKFSY